MLRKTRYPWPIKPDFKMPAHTKVRMNKTIIQKMY